MLRHRDTNPVAENLSRRKRAHVTREAASRVVLWYALAASAWILTSDWLITHIGLSRPAVNLFSSGKGILFVAITSAILYVASVGAARRIYDNEERYHRLFDNAPEGILLFRVLRGADHGITDLVVSDANPAQLARSEIPRNQIVGCKMSEPCAASRELEPYFEVARIAIAEDTTRLCDVHAQGSDRYFLTSVYPVEEDVWAAEGVEVTEVRQAQQTAKTQEERIRRAYVDVLDAVTGSKLRLMTEPEIAAALGTALSGPLLIESPSDLGKARREVADAAGATLDDPAKVGVLLSAVGEALNNALKHAGRGVYQVFAKDGRVQVSVTDEGPGIDFSNLPRATLVPGFSTAGTLGMGFTIMLQLCDRVLLATTPGRTVIVLEVSAGRTDEGP